VRRGVLAVVSKKKAAGQGYWLMEEYFYRRPFR